MTKQRITYIKKDGTKVTKEYKYDYRFYKQRSQTLIYTDGTGNYLAIDKYLNSLESKAERKKAALILKDYSDRKQKLTTYKLRQLVQQGCVEDLFNELNK